MKKISLTLMMLFAISSFTFAQSFSFGPKVGLNVSNYTGGDIKSDALVGFHLGGMLQFGVGQHFFIQPEVLFSTQGAKIDDGIDARKYKTNYVSVPVMFKLKTTGGFFIEAGPQFSFRTSEDIPNQTIDHFAKNLDLAAGAGLGYQSGAGFGISARYIAGLSKVGDFSGQNIDPDFKNSVVQISLFWAIPVVK